MTATSRMRTTSIASQARLSKTMPLRLQVKSHRRTRSWRKTSTRNMNDYVEPRTLSMRQLSRVSTTKVEPRSSRASNQVTMMTVSCLLHRPQLTKATTLTLWMCSMVGSTTPKNPSSTALATPSRPSGTKQILGQGEVGQGEVYNSVGNSESGPRGG